MEYHADPVALRVYLGLLLYEATEDLYKLNPNPGPDPAALHARFLGWAHPSPDEDSTSDHFRGGHSAGGHSTVE